MERRHDDATAAHRRLETLPETWLKAANSTSRKLKGFVHCQTDRFSPGKTARKEKAQRDLDRDRVRSAIDDHHEFAKLSVTPAFFRAFCAFFLVVATPDEVAAVEG